jgi:hypothetical protein
VRRIYTISLAHLSRKLGRWRLLLVYHRRQVTSRIREKRQRRMHRHWPKYRPKKKTGIFNAAGPAYRQPFADLSPHHTQLTWSDHYQQSPSSPSEKVCFHAVDLRSIIVNRNKAMQSRTTYSTILTRHYSGTTNVSTLTLVQLTRKRVKDRKPSGRSAPAPKSISSD